MLTKFKCSLLVLCMSVVQLSASTHPELIENQANGEACMQCHTPHTDSWFKTKHFASKDVLIDSKKASDILEDYGSTKSVLEEEACMSCHFTVKTVEKKTMPILGISCESCHGAAKNWVSIHQHSTIKDFLSYDVGKISDPKALANYNEVKAKVSGLSDEKAFKDLIHKTTASLGMIRSTDTYNLIENCYQCHTVPEPKLINTTKHKPGSSFEIIRYLTGDVLHHFNGVNEKGAANKPLSIEKRRELYVAGKLLYLENSLRALDKGEFGEGGEGSKYFEKMLLRTRRGIEDVIELNGELSGSIPEVASISELVKPFEGKANITTLKKSQLNDLIEATVKANKSFIANNSTATGLSKLDVVLEKIKTIKPYK